MRRRDDGHRLKCIIAMEQLNLGESPTLTRVACSNRMKISFFAMMLIVTATLFYVMVV